MPNGKNFVPLKSRDTHLGMSLLYRHNFEHNRSGKESGNILELSGKFSEYVEIIRKFSGIIIMDSVLNYDEHSVSDDNAGFDKETLEEANHTYNFGSGSS